MRHERSYGIVPLMKKNNQWQVLLIQHHGGHHWGFPKGHADSEDESPLQAATRELLEETGLAIIRFLSPAPFEEKYFFQRHGQLTQKHVSYFVAQVEGHVNLQEAEIANYKWVPLEDAEKHITHSQAKQVCLSTIQLLSELS